MMMIMMIVIIVVVKVKVKVMVIVIVMINDNNILNTHREREREISIVSTYSNHSILNETVKNLASAAPATRTHSPQLSTSTEITVSSCLSPVDANAVTRRSADSLH